MKVNYWQIYGIVVSEKDLLPGLPDEVHEIVRKLQDAAKCRYQFLEKRQRKIGQKQTNGVCLALAGGSK